MTVHLRCVLRFPWGRNFTGWIHERYSLLNEANERELMRHSIEALEQMTAKRPVGLRRPLWDFSRATMKLIREFKPPYDSSPMAEGIARFVQSAKK